MLARLAEQYAVKQPPGEGMLTLPELFRNILIALLLMAAVSWLLSLIKVTFAIRKVPGRKNNIFSKLLAILKDKSFSIKATDPIKGRIVLEGLVNVIDIVVYGLIGNRVVFQVTEVNNQEVQLRVYGYAAFLFIKTGIRKSEQHKVIDEGKVNLILDELMRD